MQRPISGCGKCAELTIQSHTRYVNAVIERYNQCHEGTKHVNDGCWNNFPLKIAAKPLQIKFYRHAVTNNFVKLLHTNEHTVGLYIRTAIVAKGYGVSRRGCIERNA